jgi:hypothetical protein
MTLARYSSGDTPEVVEIVQPVCDVPTGDAFVVRDATGQSFLAWADELTLLPGPALVMR